MADKTYSIAIKAVDMFSKTLSGIGKATSNLSAKISASQAKSEKYFDFGSKVKIASDGLRTLKDNSIGIFENVIKEGAAFEESMSKVGAISRVAKTSEQFKEMESAARKMGATTSFSAKEAADAMVFMSMAGLTVEKGLIPATEASLSLAKAAGVDLPRSADVVSDVMSQFTKTMTQNGVKPMEQAARVADVMALTMTSTNTSLETLYESFKYVGPVADKLNISIEETSAAIGLLGNVGIKGSSAGTAIAGAMARLASPTSQAASTLNKFGVSVRDKAGNIRGFTDIIGDLSEKTKDLGSADKMAAIVSIFGKEASRMAGMSELLAQGKKPIQDLTDKIRDSSGAAKKMADEMGDNVIGRMKEFESMQSELKLTIFYNFAKVLKDDVIPSFTKFTTEIDKFAKENPALTKFIVYAIIGFGAVAAVVSVLTVGIAWVSSMIGTLVVVGGFLGSVFTTVIVPALAYAIGFIWMAVGAVWSFTAALLANPITWIVIGILALIGAIYLLIKYWDEVYEAFSNFFESIKNWWDNLSGFAKGIISIFLPFIALPAFIISNWEDIVEGIKSVMPDWLLKLFQGDGSGDVAVSVKDTIPQKPLDLASPVPTIGEQNNTNTNNVIFDFKNLPSGVTVSKDGKPVTTPGNTGLAFGG